MAILFDFKVEYRQMVDDQLVWHMTSSTEFRWVCSGVATVQALSNQAWC